MKSIVHEHLGNHMALWLALSLLLLPAIGCTSQPEDIVIDGHTFQRVIHFSGNEWHMKHKPERNEDGSVSAGYERDGGWRLMAVKAPERSRKDISYVTMHKNSSGQIVATGPAVIHFRTGTRWEYSYEDGVIRGTAKLFHPNGQLAQEGAVMDNQRTGLHRFYKPDGSLAGACMFAQDRPVSAYTVNRDGNHIATNDFEQFQPIELQEL